MADWQVEKGRKMCSACEHEFEEREDYFGALIENSDSFTRDNYCLGCWKDTGKDDFFSYWKTRIPSSDEEPKRRFVDTEVIYMFFTKLEDTESVEKLLFRYLLCLILIRKRFLRLDNFLKEEGSEYLQVWDRKQEKELKVLNPDATEEGLENAQKELSCIFDMPFGDDEEESGNSEENFSDDEDGYDSEEEIDEEEEDEEFEDDDDSDSDEEFDDEDEDDDDDYSDDDEEEDEDYSDEDDEEYEEDDSEFDDEEEKD